MERLLTGRVEGGIAYRGQKRQGTADREQWKAPKPHSAAGQDRDLTPIHGTQEEEQYGN